MYSTKRKVYRCYNKSFNKIFESASVKVDESSSKDSKIASRYELDEYGEKEKKEERGSEEKIDQDAPTFASKTPRYVQKNHLEEQIIRDKSKGVIIRSKEAQKQVLLCLLFETKPKIVKEACNYQN